MNGMMEGYGVCVYADGSRYEGQWSGDKRHGKGTLTKLDGEKFTGEFMNDAFLI
ncbi:hypothetical protein FACS189472_15490 [Alphaproteobacteria bacterium]|nr:hypothetical protein FACS189472_15490 [Alphaproteobacteria bacterium]